MAHSGYFGTCYSDRRVQERCIYHWYNRNIGLYAGSCLVQVPHSCIDSSHLSFTSLNSHWSLRWLSLAWISVKQTVIHFFLFQAVQFIECCLPYITLIMWRFKISSLYYSFTSPNYFAGSIHQKTYTSDPSLFCLGGRPLGCGYFRQQSLFLLVCRCNLSQQVFALKELGFCCPPFPLYLVFLLRIRYFC